MAYRARYKGICASCHKSIEIGQLISWSRGKNKKVYHVDCNNPNKEQEAQATHEMAGTDAEETGTATKTIQVDNEETIPMGESKPVQEMGDVQQALQTLLGALNKPQAPVIDKAEIRQMVESIVSEKGVVTLKIERHEAPTVEVENAHHMLSTLVQYAAKGRHTYLYGPAGSGKSTAARQVAEALGRAYHYISLTPQTPESRLMGYMDANGHYVRTPFREAYENGGIFNIEEADNGGGNLQTSLNSAFENGHCAFPDGLVAKHKDFVVVATGNTCGRGASPQFPERRPFDQAFAKRFTYIHWGYDEKLEKKIALAINENAGAWVTWIQRLRKWADNSRAVLVASPRETFRIVEDLRDNLPREIVLNGALWNGNEELRDKALANVPLPA